MVGASKLLKLCAFARGLRDLRFDLTQRCCKNAFHCKQIVRMSCKTEAWSSIEPLHSLNITFKLYSFSSATYKWHRWNVNWTWLYCSEAFHGWVWCVSTEMCLRSCQNRRGQEETPAERYCSRCERRTAAWMRIILLMKSWSEPWVTAHLIPKTPVPLLILLYSSLCQTKLV